MHTAILYINLGLIHVEMQSVPEKNRGNQASCGLKFGADPHHLYLLLANTSNSTRWIQEGGEPSVISPWDSGETTRHVIHTLRCGYRRHKGLWLFLWMLIIMLLNCATFLLIFYLPGFILMCMCSCKGGWETHLWVTRKKESPRVLESLHFVCYQLAHIASLGCSPHFLIPF